VGFVAQAFESKQHISSTGFVSASALTSL